jgi:hypothetical protein
MPRDPIAPDRSFHKMGKATMSLTRMASHCKTILEHLEEHIHSTSESSPVRKGRSYRLQRPPRDAIEKSNRERILEQAIWRQFGDRAVNRVFLDGTSPQIQAYQVPLYGTRKADGWGKVDLVGVTSNGGPVVIELKDERAKDPPLRMLTEALAYACAVRKAWDAGPFQTEWQEAMHLRGIPAAFSAPGDVPVVLLAPHSRWQRMIGQPGIRSFGKVPAEAWGPFLELTHACKSRHGHPVHFVGFDSGPLDNSGLPQISNVSEVAVPSG